MLSSRASLRSFSLPMNTARRAMRWMRASWRPRIVDVGARNGYRHSDNSRLLLNQLTDGDTGVERRGEEIGSHPF